MTVQATRSNTEVKFSFYTYNPIGHDIVVTVYAQDVDDAWAQFDEVYGKDTPVDAVRTCTGELV
jgi:hypothetical protein